MDTIQKKITINVPKRDKRIYCIHKKGMFAVNIDIKNQKVEFWGEKFQDIEFVDHAASNGMPLSLASFQFLPILTFFDAGVILKSVRNISFGASCFIAFCPTSDLFHKYSKLKEVFLVFF